MLRPVTMSVKWPIKVDSWIVTVVVDFVGENTISAVLAIVVVGIGAAVFWPTTFGLKSVADQGVVNLCSLKNPFFAHFWRIHPLMCRAIWPYA